MMINEQEADKPLKKKDPNKLEEGYMEAWDIVILKILFLMGKKKKWKSVSCWIIIYS
jgi:hypothetical protein